MTFIIYYTTLAECRQTYRQTYRKTYRLTYRLTYRQTDIQTYRQTHRQTVLAVTITYYAPRLIGLICRQTELAEVTAPQCPHIQSVYAPDLPYQSYSLTLIRHPDPLKPCSLSQSLHQLIISRSAV